MNRRKFCLPGEANPSRFFVKSHVRSSQAGGKNAAGSSSEVDVNSRTLLFLNALSTIEEEGCPPDCSDHSELS
jgi:hypothetical protein